MNIRYLVAAAAAVVACACTRETFVDANGTGQTGGGDAAYVMDDTGAVEGWIRIKLADNGLQLATGTFTRGAANSGSEELDSLAAALGATEIRRVFNIGGKFEERQRRWGLHLWYDVRFDDNVPVSRAGAGFAALPQVEYVEPVYEARISGGALPASAVYEPATVRMAADAATTAMFDDPMLRYQWHYDSDGSINGVRTGCDMNLAAGWQYETGSRDVIVAVADSGIDYAHEDLAANMWTNEAELNGTEGVDDDGNGLVDDIYGWNYSSNSGTLIGEDHGTHVAGTIAAVNGNGLGVCGVAGGSGAGDGVRVMALQIFENNVGTANPDYFIYAADNGAVIVNNSWTWSPRGTLPQSYSTAFDYFIANAGMDENGVQTGPMAGGLIICAAGNIGSAIEYPAADERTVAVTAMDSQFNLADYSNRGPEADIMAPGGTGTGWTGANRIMSTIPNNDYGYYYGTSMACPHVTGLAALIVSYYGGEGFTAEKCRNRLMISCAPASGVETSELADIGVGMLDAGAAFAVDPGTAPEAAVITSIAANNNTIILNIETPADGNDDAVLQYRIECNSGEAVDYSETVRVHADVGSSARYSVTANYNTDYTVNVIAIDRFGNESQPVSAEVTTGMFDNRSPERVSQLRDVTIEGTGEENAVDVDLSEFFTDPDLEYGDVLSYTATSVHENIAELVVEGNILHIVPRSEGASLVTVVAADLAGDSVSGTMYVTVRGGGETGGEGEAGSSVILYPNPAADELNIALDGATGDAAVRIYDAGGRLVQDTVETLNGGTITIGVTGLTPGVYTVVVECGGSEFKSSFVKQ